MRRKALAILLLLVSAMALLWLRNGPRNPADDHLKAAIDAINGGDLATFDAMVMKIRTSSGPPDHLVFLSGLRHLRFGRADAALGRFASLAPEGILRHPLMRYTAEALHQLNRKVEAIELLREVLKEHPDDLAAHRWLAVTYYDLGAYDLAIPHLNQLIEFDPSDFRPFRTLGEIYHEMQIDSQAINAWMEVLHLDPPAEIRQDVCVRLAETFLRQKQFEQSLKYVAEGARSVDSLTIRGQCLLSLGRIDEASTVLSEARSMDSEALPVLLLSAAIQATNKNNSAEISDLEMACRLYPFEPSAFYGLALALQNSHRESEAAAAMAKYQRLTLLITELSAKSQQILSDSANPTLRMELAEICDELGRQDLSESWRSAAAAMQSKRKDNVN